MSAGVVKLGHIALDGTKVRANASKHKAMSYDRMVKVKEEARLQAEVQGLLTQAEAADAQDEAVYGPDRRGDELPAEVARRELRLNILDEGVHEGLAIEVDTSLPAERVIRVLEQLVSWRSCPQALLPLILWNRIPPGLCSCRAGSRHPPAAY